MKFYEPLHRGNSFLYVDSVITFDAEKKITNQRFPGWFKNELRFKQGNHPTLDPTLDLFEFQMDPTRVDSMDLLEF